MIMKNKVWMPVRVRQFMINDKSAMLWLVRLILSINSFWSDSHYVDYGDYYCKYDE